MRLYSTIAAMTFTMIAVSGNCACAEDRSSGWYSSFEAAQAEAKRLNRPILVHFHADWCGPCRRMEQNVLHRTQVLGELRRSVVAVKVNVDRSPSLAARYNVDTLPMDLFLEPGGRKIVESSGYRSVSEYVAAARRAATKYSDLVAERSPPAASDEESALPETTLVGNGEQQPMMRGYCPVTLWKNRKWEKGSPQFRFEHRGQAFEMASEEALRDFSENPTRYAPQYLGCDPVVVYESDRAVLGSTKYGAFYDDQLYLFVTSDNRQAFKSDPDTYIRTRVVLNLDEVEQIVR